ncbi:MAG TPA: GH116 family glycosyl hydrolase [Abditibacteriaceae bacterium]|jgi:uncharacterized protein (DUF608 family)
MKQQPAAFSTPRHFEGADLLQIAMPMGGIGAGCICLNGYGGLQDFSIRNKPHTTASPDGHSTEDSAFALLHVKGAQPVTKLLEGPLPVEKIYDQGLQGQGYRHGGHEGLTRFENCSFESQYPFGCVSLTDSRVPLRVSIEGWNPFIPLDDVNSGLPCAVLEYTFTNCSTERVEFEFSYHLSHLAVPRGKWENTRNSVIPPRDNVQGGGVFLFNTAGVHDESYGSAAVYALGAQPQIKAMWFRGGWFDSLSVLWREIETGRFTPNDGTEEARIEGNNGGSLLIKGAVAPGEAVTYPIVIAWHFPNSNQRVGEQAEAASTIPSRDCGSGCDCGPQSAPAWRPFYAGKWQSAQEVALYVANEYSSLRLRTQRFTDALFASTLPPCALDAIASNLAILKSLTVLRQENGTLWGWEGCFVGGGCCHGSCTHVWNYAQALPHLFPQLERTLREAELQLSMDEQGHVNFRAALPDGPASHGYHPAADGQLGGILKLYRDYHISGNREWLEQLYPLAKCSLDYCIERWDPQRTGGLFEPHHNTYDIEFWGPDGMCGSIYVGALAAMAEMARALGKFEEAQPYAELAERAAQFMDKVLFNGEYYQQDVTWEGLRDTSFVQQVAEVNASSSEMLRLLKAEGPKYQYGAGCISDGVIGAWMATIYGVETPLNVEHVRSMLGAIFENNFKNDLFDHACTQRPGYAMGHEAGLLLCSWPRGGKPTLPFVYSDEVWTGIEYQVASHLIAEGFVNEGVAVVQAVRNRYEGHVRNPFNEYECGNYYARAMSSYALLQALSGFRYSAVDKTLWFGPKTEAKPFRSFFCTQSGYGTITLDEKGLTVEVLEGKLAIQTLCLMRDTTESKFDWDVVVQAGQRVSRDWI